MQLDEIYTDVNLQTDESYDNSTLLPFFNDAVSFINRRKHTYYPYLPANTSSNYEYTALKETWIRQIVINYMCHLVKTLDSSQFEYTDFLKKCEDAMEDFMQVKDPDEYASGAEGHEDEGVEIYQIDQSNNIINNRW